MFQELTYILKGSLWLPGGRLTNGAAEEAGKQPGIGGTRRLDLGGCAGGSHTWSALGGIFGDDG